jgi:signal transduction histidine kinase
MEDLAAQLKLANTQLEAAIAELLFEQQEKAKRAAELTVANIELDFQNEEKEKRAAELILANTELLFQNQEKEDRANELAIANKELLYQNQEKQDRADELAVANSELIFQNEEREKRATAAAKKDEFFNMVSHELKTPLTNIKAINQILAKSLNKADRSYRFIARSDQSILRLERLIEDLLDVTKINTGDIDLNLSEFFFTDILTQSIETVQQISPQHTIILENSVDIFYTGDQFRLERVIINLLNNAIKYSPDATQVKVNAFVKGGQITVCVIDSGIGIAKEDITQLFKRFFRVSKIAKQFHGVGLGLYIAAEIVKKHNGTFSITSEPGIGSSFSFHLPVN